MKKQFLLSILLGISTTGLCMNGYKQPRSPEASNAAQPKIFSHDENRNSRASRRLLFFESAETPAQREIEKNREMMEKSIATLEGLEANNLQAYLLCFNQDPDLILPPVTPLELQAVTNYFKEKGGVSLNVSAKVENTLRIYLSQRSDLDQSKKLNENDEQLTNAWIARVQDHITLLNFINQKQKPLKKLKKIAGKNEKLKGTTQSKTQEGKLKTLRSMR